MFVFLLLTDPKDIFGITMIITEYIIIMLASWSVGLYHFELPV